MKARKSGFKQKIDNKDLNYPISTLLLGSPKVKFLSKSYSIGNILNQGYTSACVGYACSQILSSDPKKMKSPDPLEIYSKAREIDEFDNNKTEGTSIRAGLNTLKSLNLIDKFYWAFSVQDIIDYLLLYGPIITGTSWYEGMSTPINGTIKVKGQKEISHAYVLNGVNLQNGYFTGVNSWGKYWGINGQFKISIQDFEQLLSNGGVAAAVVK
jgi:hypothetical protein